MLHTIGPEKRPGGEAIFAAADRKQAGIGFREAAGIIREDKRLVAAVGIYDAHNAPKKLIYRKEASYLEVISGDGGPQHGRTPGFVLADEIHIWKGRDLWEALTTGLEKIDDSLLVVASTAGRGQDSLAFEFFEDARNVARGKVDDESILAFEAGATASLFGLEGPLRAGIRADLCRQGWTWQDADDMAREMLSEAFRAVHATRPGWDEGQPEWAISAGTLIERTYCIRCHAPLPEGHFKFCSRTCGASHNQRLATRKEAGEHNAVELAMTWI